jgi:hypothetical protein
LWSGNERVHCNAHDTDHVCETGHACEHENPSPERPTPQG